MTFTDLVSGACERLNLTSTDSMARIGRFVNGRHRRVTSALGLQTSRRTTVQATTTLGVSYLTFALEKLHRVYLPGAAGTQTVLTERTFDYLRGQTFGSGIPTEYAISTMDASSVTVLLNVVPQEEVTLYADGMANAVVLAGSQEPLFSASFHDLLMYGAMADELRKMEKPTLAKENENIFEQLLSDLRMHIAKSSSLVQKQNGAPGSFGLSGGGAAGGSGLPNGATSYTQTGLITFDRVPNAPFAVPPGSATVPNLVAAYAESAGSVGGEDAADFHDATQLVGAVPLANLVGLTNAQVDAAAAIAWTKVSKTGSSLADLTTRSASDLSSGTLPDARFPATLPAVSGANLTNVNAATLGTKAPPSGAIVGTTDTQTLSNKTLSSAVLSDAVRFTGVISPTLAAGNNNDLDVGAAAIVRLGGDPGGTSALTGISAAQTDGRILILCNAGAPTFTLKNNNAGSAVANRLLLVGNADLALQAGDSLLVWYDALSSLWRVASGF